MSDLGTELIVSFVADILTACADIWYAFGLKRAPDRLREWANKLRLVAACRCPHGDCGDSCLCDCHQPVHRRKLGIGGRPE